MARKFVKARGLGRRAPVREASIEFVVVCEGKVTEPTYLKRLQRLWHYPNTLLTLELIGGAGVPTSVVDRAIEEKNKRKKRSKKTGDSFERFEVWAAFDRDSFAPEILRTAFQRAEANDINVAFSNPCFELWGLLHFAPYNRPGHHHEIHNELSKKIQGYHHQTNPVICPIELKDYYHDAVANAKEGVRLRRIDGLENGDPSTTVHILTERLRDAAEKQ